MFIGFGLSEELHSALEAVQQQLRTQGVKARYVAQNNLHVTLLFLGEVADPAVPAQLIAEALADFREPVELALDGFGAFGDRSVHVTIRQNPELLGLQAALAERFEPLIGAENRRYRPHVTVARGVQTKDAWVEVPARKMLANEVTLFESSVTKGRRLYKPIFTYPLENRRFG
jgi:2'-5' RNA ligase